MQGREGVQSSMAFMTSSSMRTEEANFSPPWTTRWPTASISAMLATTPYSALVSFVYDRGDGLTEWVGREISSLKTGLPPTSGVCFR